MYQKVQLVQKHRDEHGHNRCCEVLGLSKSTWHYRQNGYGSERSDDELRAWDLAIQQAVQKPARSRVDRILDEASGCLNRVRGRTFGPLEMFSGDFTQVAYANGSLRAWLMAMVDPVSRLAPGWALGTSRNRRLAQRCFQQVQTTYERLEVPLSGTMIHQDRDAVFTSYDWLRRVLIDAGCEVSFSERGTRGSP